MVGARGFEPLSPCGQPGLSRRRLAICATPPSKDTCCARKKKPSRLALSHTRHVIDPADPRSSRWSHRRMTEGSQKPLGLDAFSLEARNIRRVIHPPDQLDGLGFRVSKLPDGMTARLVPDGDRSRDACEPRHGGS